MTVLRFAGPGRELPGETDQDRTRRMLSEQSLIRSYRRAERTARGADPATAADRFTELAAYIAGTPSPDWEEVARLAGRVSREARKLRARDQLAGLMEQARDRGMVR